MLNQKLLKYYHQISSAYKLFSTVENVQFAEQIVKKNNSQETCRKISGTIEIREYLKNNDTEYFEKYLPKKILRRSTIRSAKPLSYIIDKDVAETLASMISQDLSENSSFVIECNPGLGLLTEELLKIGVPSIYLYEKCSDFVLLGSPLSSLIEKNQSRLHLRQLDFSNIWMSLLRDEYNDRELSEDYLQDIPHIHWKQKSCAQIIAICSNRNFLTLLIHNFYQQTRIYDHGRPTFYLIVPSFIWMRLSLDESSPPSRFYSHYNVILRLFFNYKLFGKLPRTAFLPWCTNKGRKISQDYDMSVIKMEPKINTFSILPKEDLKEFWFFLKYFMRSRKLRVISEFERLVPGCGEKMIEDNMDICTTFKELSPKKLLDLFKTYKSWPEYDRNLFMPNIITSEETKKEEEEKIEVEDQSREATASDFETASRDKLKNKLVN